MSLMVFPEVLNLVFPFKMPVWPPKVHPSSPAYPLWAMYRARALVWTAIQTNMLPTMFFEEAIPLLVDAKNAFPENKLLLMYFGEDEPRWEDCANHPKAPRWANDAHCILVKLLKLIKYWCDHQADDGSFGGGWGDDVELGRWWTAVLSAFDSGSSSVPLKEAWTKLSEEVWKLDRMKDGYACPSASETDDLGSFDVAHTAEESTDTLIPMMLLRLREKNFRTLDDLKNDTWFGKAYGIFQLYQQEWLSSGNDEKGRLQFPSTHLKCHRDDFGDSRKYACDVPRHLRALEPVVFLYQLIVEARRFSNDSSFLDPLIAELEDSERGLHVWFDNYVAATVVEGDGCKDKGVLPAVLAFPSGATRTDQLEKIWFEPGCHKACITLKDDNECSFSVCTVSNAYSFPDGAGPLMKAMALLRHLKLDQTYLEPVRSLAQLARSYDKYKSKIKKTNVEKPEPGTGFDVGRKKKGLRDAVAVTINLQREVGATEMEFKDELDDGSYEHFVLKGKGATGEEDLVGHHASLPGLYECRNALSRHKEALTSECKYTDRCTNFAEKYLKKHGIVGEKFDDPKVKDFITVYQFLTGDVSDGGGIANLQTVRWGADPSKFIALVLRHSLTSLVAQLFSYDTTDATISASFLRLSPGEYNITLITINDDPTIIFDATFNVVCFGELLCDPPTVSFSIPHETLLLLQVHVLHIDASFDSTTLAYGSPTSSSQWDGTLDFKSRYYKRKKTDCKYDESNVMLRLYNKARDAWADACS